MSIEFECDACQKRYRVNDELAGKSAMCTCGARLTIPQLAPEPLLEQDHLFAELSAPPVPPVQSLTLAASQDEDAVLEKKGQTAAGDPAEAWKGWLPALGKIGGGGLVGLFLGAKAIVRNRNRNQAALSPTTQILIICGVGVLGALVASLLIVKDTARHRKAADLPMPALMRWYFANGFLSVLLWIATAFVGVIFVVVALAM